jgi:hypothetical protein
MTMQNVLIALAIWTTGSVVFGFAFGAVMKQCALWDDELAPAHTDVGLEKSA